jgi:hypothetical protein
MIRHDADHGLPAFLRDGHHAGGIWRGSGSSGPLSPIHATRCGYIKGWMVCCNVCSLTGCWSVSRRSVRP